MKLIKKSEVPVVRTFSFKNSKMFYRFAKISDSLRLQIAIGNINATRTQKLKSVDIHFG